MMMMMMICYPYPIFPFLKLPREIRDEIYNCIFAHLPRHKTSKRRPKMGILFTCRTIYNEALWILHRTTRFQMVIRPFPPCEIIPLEVPPTVAHQVLDTLTHLEIRIDVYPVLNAGLDRWAIRHLHVPFKDW